MQASNKHCTDSLLFFNIFLLLSELVRIGVDEVHQFLTSLCLFESAREVARHGYGALLLHATHLHAHVLSFNHYHHSEGVECVLDALAYLLCEAFLHLQTM